VVTALQKLADLFDDLMVLLFRLITSTGCHASFDFKLDTGAVGGAIDVDRAGGKREDVLDDFQRLSQGVRWGIGAIVKRAVFLHAAHDRQSRKVLFDRQPHIGILFIVPQHDVETRLVTLDQVAFENQRFEL